MSEIAKRYRLMIERLGASATGTQTPAIQPVMVPSTPGVAGSVQAEILVHKASLIGEAQWLGAMNAFRIGRTFAAQQQLLATAKGNGALTDPIANPSKSAPIPCDTAVLQGPNQAGEPTLIPSIKQMDDDRKMSNDFRGQPGLGREARLFTAGANREMADGVNREAAEVACADEANPEIATQGEAKQSRDSSSANPKRTVRSGARANILGPAVFGGHLVRRGQTSQFVVELQT